MTTSMHSAYTYARAYIQTSQLTMAFNQPSICLIFVHNNYYVKSWKWVQSKRQEIFASYKGCFSQAGDHRFPKHFL